MPDDESLDEPHQQQRPALTRPNHASGEDAGTWSLIAHDKSVLEGWRIVCRRIPENALRCYNWLRAHPTKRIPGRCYELKGKKYAGAWGYEVGSGDRVYYKPRPDKQHVLIFYAGPHPKRGVPYPPAEEAESN